MKNEGPKILIIAFLIMLLMYFLSVIFSIDFNNMIVIGIIGWGVYRLWITIKKLIFPVVFDEPDEEQRLIVGYYFNQVEKMGNDVKVKPIGLVLIFVLVFLVGLFASIGREYEGVFWITRLLRLNFMIHLTVMYFLLVHLCINLHLESLLRKNI